MSQLGRLLIFLAVFLTIVGGLHYYFWARLVRDTALPLLWARVGTLSLVLLALSIPATFILGRVLNRPLSGLAWVAYVWMGLFFFLFVALLATDVLRGGVGLTAWLRGAPVDPERRQLLSRALAGVASAFAGSAGLAGLAAVMRPVQVKRVEVVLDKLPAALDGFTIAAISDVHLGPTIGAEFMRDVVARVNALGADVIAIVGDLVDGSVEELQASAAPLGSLKAPHGVWFVTGNHEYYSGAPEWIAHLRSMGIETLGNRRVTLARGEAQLELAGTHDLTGEGELGHDLGRALHGRDAARPLVLLSHQPRTFPQAAKQGVDLQISGHTHGGQLWPWGFVVRLQQGFLAGLSQLGQAQLYVSCGTGYWGPPMRLGAPAEISQLVLRVPGARPTNPL